MLSTNPDNPLFINAVKNLSEGDTLEVIDGILEVEAVFEEPTHFPWHQRIFEPGMILKKQDSRTRIYIDNATLGKVIESYPEGHYDDKQILDGEIIPGEGLKIEET